VAFARSRVARLPRETLHYGGETTGQSRCTEGLAPARRRSHVAHSLDVSPLASHHRCFSAPAHQPER